MELGITKRLLLALLITILSFGYLLPFAITLVRDSNSKILVFFINLLLGWTVVGWVIALILAFKKPSLQTSIEDGGSMNKSAEITVLTIVGIFSGIFGLFGIFGVGTVVVFSSGESSGISRVIFSSDFGDEWPLTVSSGTIECEVPSVVTFTTDNRKYALNETALSRGFADIDPIWKADPSELVPKMNIGVLISYGLDLCE